MPIPLIGVPWYQLRHLPDALVICHEVGHAVESDLELPGRTAALVEGAVQVPDARRALWREWRHEAFADIFGTICGGPAFAWTIHDFLGASPSTIQAERRGVADTYPTCTLRVLIVAETLRLLGFSADAASLEQAWRAVYGRHELQDFEADVPHVARALFQGPYPELGAGGLLGGLQFTAKEDEEARRDADLLTKNIAPLATGARGLYAAAALAFHAAPRTMTADRQETVLRRILAHREEGTRGPSPEAPEEQKIEADRNVVEELLGTLDDIGVVASTKDEANATKDRRGRRL